VVSVTDPYDLILGFIDRSRYFSYVSKPCEIQVFNKSLLYSLRYIKIKSEHHGYYKEIILNICIMKSTGTSQMYG
jgi:hypothetical protein